jgi:hypothetical protein
MKRTMNPAILGTCCFDERFAIPRYPVTHVLGVLVTFTSTNRYTLICNLINTSPEKIMADVLRCEVRSARRMRTEVTCRRHKTYSTSRLP